MAALVLMSNSQGLCVSVGLTTEPDMSDFRQPPATGWLTERLTTWLFSNADDRGNLYIQPRHRHDTMLFLHGEQLQRCQAVPAAPEPPTFVSATR